MSELVNPSRVMFGGQSGLRHLAGAHGVLPGLRAGTEQVG